MAKWYLDGILENRVNASVNNAQKKHEIFLNKNANALKEIETKRDLCKKLIAEGKKEEAKKLWQTIKEEEAKVYSTY